MHKGQFVTGWFFPLDAGARPEHPIELPPGTPGEPPSIWPSPGHPEHPIVIPPLVGIWPSPGQPAHPIVLPPGTDGPVYIEGTPDKPIKSAAGTLQPALPAGALPPGKVALLVEVVGVPGKRWLTVDNTPTVQPLGK